MNEGNYYSKSLSKFSLEWWKKKITLSMAMLEESGLFETVNLLLGKVNKTQDFLPEVTETCLCARHPCKPWREMRNMSLSLF